MSEDAHPAQYFLDAAEETLQQEFDLDAVQELDELLPPYPLLLTLLMDWAGSPDAEESPQLDAFTNLVDHALHQLRIELRRGDEEAVEFWQLLQELLGEALESGDKPVFCHGLLDGLATQGFPLPEALIDRVAAWHEKRYSAEIKDATESGADPEQGLRELFDQPGMQPADIYGMLKTQLQYLPANKLDTLYTGLLQVDNSNLLEGLLHCLLHPRALVRERLLEQLRLLREPIGAHQLNRLVMLRNWLPPEQAKQLDAVVRQQRKHNLPPAAASRGSVRIWASAPDGAGATAVIMCREKTGRYQLSGAILKENTGILDCWQSPHLKKREADAGIQEIRSQLPQSLPVDPEFLQQLLPHFLALNLRSGEMPEPELLDWLEALGGDLWQPQTLDIGDWLRDAEPELQDWDRDKAFRRLASWFDKHLSELRWFENDTATIERAEEWLLAEDPQPEQQILEEILAPHRPKWRDRFALMAIWAKSNLNKRGPHWQDFALLARAADTDQPVVELPILPVVAGHTLAITSEEMTAREELAEELEDEDWDGEEWDQEDWGEDEFPPQPDLFADAPADPVRSEKVGRNEPCPCGSGRKHKKCCMA